MPATNSIENRQQMYQDRDREIRAWQRNIFNVFGETSAQAIAATAEFNSFVTLYRQGLPCPTHPLPDLTKDIPTHMRVAYMRKKLGMPSGKVSRFTTVMRKLEQ